MPRNELNLQAWHVTSRSRSGSSIFVGRPAKLELSLLSDNRSQDS